MICRAQNAIYLAAVQFSGGDLRAQEELVAVKAASGDVQGARAMAQESLVRFPLSAFLREEVGQPDMAQLANDTNRVLSIAGQYIRLGLYQKALGVLSRRYPPAVADQSEPGALAPQNHPMIAYFRGYCRDKLGQSGKDDYIAASKMPTAYVFPSTAEELGVLHAVLQSQPSDGTAHYLLGTFYFSRGVNRFRA